MCEHAGFLKKETSEYKHTICKGKGAGQENWRSSLHRVKAVKCTAYKPVKCVIEYGAGAQHGRRDGHCLVTEVQLAEMPGS